MPWRAGWRPAETLDALFPMIHGRRIMANGAMLNRRKRQKRAIKPISENPPGEKPKYNPNTIEQRRMTGRATSPRGAILRRRGSLAD
jgi:hypothetical protein